MRRDGGWRRRLGVSGTRVGRGSNCGTCGSGLFGAAVTPCSIASPHAERRTRRISRPTWPHVDLLRDRAIHPVVIDRLPLAAAREVTAASISAASAVRSCFYPGPRGDFQDGCPSPTRRPKTTQIRERRDRGVSRSRRCFPPTRSPEGTRTSRSRSIRSKGAFHHRRCHAACTVSPGIVLRKLVPDRCFMSAAAAVKAANNPLHPRRHP